MKTYWDNFLERYRVCAQGAAALRRSELQLAEVQGAFANADDDAGKQAAEALRAAAAALELARRSLNDALAAARIKSTRTTTTHQEHAHVG